MTLKKPITNLFFMLIVVGCSIAATQLTLKKISDMDDFNDPISRLELTIASMREGNIPSDFKRYQAEPSLRNDKLNLKKLKSTPTVKMDLTNEGCKNFILLNFRAANAEENKLIFIGVSPGVNEAAKQVKGENGLVLHLDLNDKSGNPLISHTYPATYMNLVVIKQEGSCFFDFLESQSPDYNKDLHRLKPFYTLLKPVTLLFKKPSIGSYDDIKDYQRSLETKTRQVKSYPSRKDVCSLEKYSYLESRVKVLQNTETFIKQSLRQCKKETKTGKTSIFSCFSKQNKVVNSGSNDEALSGKATQEAMKLFDKDFDSKILYEKELFANKLNTLQLKKQFYLDEQVDHIYKLLSLDTPELYFELRKNDLIYALRIVFQKAAMRKDIELRQTIIKKNVELYEGIVAEYQKGGNDEGLTYIEDLCKGYEHSLNCIKKLLETKYKIAKSLIVLGDSNSNDDYLYPAFLFAPYGITIQDLQMLDNIYKKDNENYGVIYSQNKRIPGQLVHLNDHDHIGNHINLGKTAKENFRKDLKKYHIDWRFSKSNQLDNEAELDKIISQENQLNSNNLINLQNGPRKLNMIKILI